MPCNPSIGGPAKGHLVRELDALGGQMGISADLACIQMRLLNTGKGYAVHALRGQEDKPYYHTLMKKIVEEQENLELKQLMIDKLLVENGQVVGVKIVLDYANRLVDDGFSVDVVYSAFSPFNIWDIKHRLVYMLQFLAWSVSRSWLPRWMRVDGRVRQRLVWSHGHFRYPHDAIFIATSVDTAVELNKYKIPDDNKFYFIQDFENWFVSSDLRQISDCYSWFHTPNDTGTRIQFILYGSFCELPAAA